MIEFILHERTLQVKGMARGKQGCKQSFKQMVTGEGGRENKKEGKLVGPR